MLLVARFLIQFCLSRTHQEQGYLDVLRSALINRLVLDLSKLAMTCYERSATGGCFCSI